MNEWEKRRYFQIQYEVDANKKPNCQDDESKFMSYLSG